MKIVCPQKSMDRVLEKLYNPGETRSRPIDPAACPNLYKLYQELKAVSARHRRQPEGKIIQLSDYMEGLEVIK